VSQSNKVEFLPATPERDDSDLSPKEIVRTDWEATLHSLANSNTKTVRIPTSNQLKRQQVVDAFLDSFQLIGGTPRLALWADENPTEFYRLFAKLAPREQKNTSDGKMTIQHVLPRTDLD